MFLAMPFMDVVWDDDLLGGHEYQEQAEYVPIWTSTKWMD
jgi:hypothetical protein